jgi:hypothetical protein
MFKVDSSPEEIASYVEKCFEQAQQARMPVERQWLLNLAFYYGKQWVTWGPVVNNTARLIEPKAPKWRTRLVINKIEPYVRREMSRLSTMKPRGYVMPSSPDEGDKSAARVAEQIVDYLHEDTGLDIAMEKVDWWTCIAGPGFLKVRFTEELDTSSGLPGKLRVDALRPFDIYVPDQEETRLQEQDWIMQVSSMTKEKVKELWGVDVQASDGVSEIEQRVRNVMSIFNEKMDDRVLVKEMWIKPCTRFPKGLVVSVANSTLLPMEVVEPEMLEEAVEPRTPEGTIEWPYAHGKYPFVRRGHTMSGKFYDTSFVWTIISLQREYNRTRSQIIENKNITSRPQWAMQKGSVDKNQLTTEPGAVIQYAPGSTPPVPIQPPQLPNYVIEHLRLTSDEMDEIASQNAVSKGSVPPGVEAATAIAYLQERDDAAVGYAIRSRERAYQEVSSQLLSLVQEFWDAERVVRVVGQNSNFDAFVLKGADLKGNTDYRVVVGSGTPISRAAQKAEIMELWKGGGLPGSKALRALNMPDMEAVINEVEINSIQAQRENLKMSRNVWEMVEDFHDHIAHIQEHDDFRKKEEFQGLDQMVKDMIRFHTYMHMQMLGRMFNMMPMDAAGMPIMPEQPPMVMGPQGPQPQPFFVDPVFEFELRKIFVQLQAGAGAPAEQGPTP